MAHFEYPCFLLKQRGDQDGAPPCCIFQAPVGAILKWAAIQRIQEQRGNVQRASNKAKVRAIKRFLSLDPRNIIPTAVIVTLRIAADALTEIDCGQGRHHHLIGFDVQDDVAERDKPGLVVDGQHRLLGIREFNAETPVPIVALINPDALETAFQFLVINNKASKVSTDHIRALALEYNEERLEDRLKAARLTINANYEYVGSADTEEDSPFRGIIAWPANRAGEQIVPPAAIEQSLQYIQDQAIKDLQDEDSLLEFYFAIWNTVKRVWPNLWTADSKLLLKVGIICMTQYLTDSLAKAWEFGELSLNDPAMVGRKTEALLEKQEPTFWLTTWKAGSYDTRVGRQLIVEDLVRITRNLRANEIWYDNLVVVDLPHSRQEN